MSIPDRLVRVGDRAFAGLGLKEVVFPPQLKTIGLSAFANNNIEYLYIPDSVEEISGGAFATNPRLKKITIPENNEYTVIESGTFGCSDKKNWMKDLTSIEIPETITEIGDNAFGGNNFSTIEIPSSVEKIGKYAFSTKNYLKTPTTLVLNEGLKEIGSRAFRNKKIEAVVLPVSLKSLPQNTFEKVDTDPSTGHGADNSLITKVFVTTEDQYNDRSSFPDSNWHKIYLNDPKKWTADDFEIGDAEFGGESVKAILGFSEQGLTKVKLNSKLELPAEDSEGRTIEAVASKAFDESVTGSAITKLSMPAGIRFVGDSAFRGNKLTVLEFTEGLNEIGEKAFSENKVSRVSFPASLVKIDEGAFEKNVINAVVFKDGGEEPLTIGARAFAVNKIKTLQAADNLDVLDGTAFAENPGTDTDEGVVYIYKPSEGGTSLACKSQGTSEVQEVIFGEIPAELAPWGPRHFISEGEVITGLSEDGEAKLKVDTYLVIPGKAEDGTEFTTIDTGAFADHGGNKGVAADGYESPIFGVEFAPSITTVKMRAFNMCAIRDLELPDTIKTIEPSAFGSNYGMRSIKLSESMTEIPDGAFVTNATTMDMNTGVHDIVIPDGVTRIGKSAFAGQHVKNLTLPDTLTEIADNAFQNHQIRELVIPGSVRKIGKRAFEVRQEGAEPMPEQLTLNRGLTEIGSQAFGQTALESVQLPVTLTSIPADSFVDWKGNGRKDGEPVVLRSSIQSQSDGTGSYTGIAVEGNGHKVIFDKMVGTGWDYDDFTYSDDGTTITGWTEKGNYKRLANAVIPVYPPMVMPDKPSYDSDQYITEIGENAFQLKLKNENKDDGEVTMRKFDCDSPFGIQRVVFPAKLQKIGACAFEYNNLQAVNLQSVAELESIGTSAFHGNHLRSVVIPETITDLGGGAFAMNNIVSLKLPKSVTKIPQGCFSMNIFMSEVDIPDTVTEIDDMAFAGARLETLEIPASVTRIGRKAFHLHHLKSLYIPGNVKIVDESAFEGTFKDSTLTDLKIGEGVEYIGKYAFKEALLEEVILPSSLKDMGESPFYSNKGKDGSRVVELYTGNRDHLKFNNDEYHVLENGISKHYHIVILDKEIRDPTEEDIAEREAALDEITETIVSANSILAGGEYTAASFKKLKEAIDVANALFDDPKTLKSDVDAAKAEILRAVRSLEPVDKAAAEESRSVATAADSLARTLIDVYNNVAKANYRKADYKKFVKTVEDAEEALADAGSDTARLNSARTDLLKAWVVLEKAHKKAQPMKVKAKSVKLKVKTLKKKALTIKAAKALTIKNAKGRKIFRIVKAGKAKKYFRINRKTGKIKVGNGLKKGTYKVTVKITAAGNDEYLAGSKTATIKVRVR